MRLLRLELLAYGPFSEKMLDLSDGNAGLHLIYGPNEAGKSAALRGLTNLFFGFPTRTTDNFRHDNARLRVGGHIRHSDGEELHFLRRKGLKDTLLDGSGKALADGVLQKYLGELTRELFITMFGMDHHVLIEGGKALVAGGGGIGESLFAAGMGIAGMRQILEALEAESEGLFKPSGRLPVINRLTQNFKEVKKQCADKSLSSKMWSTHDRALRSAEKEKRLVVGDLQMLLSERNRLERLQKAMPKIVSLQRTREELNRMGAVVPISPEFSEQRQTAQETLRRAKASAARLQGDLKQVEKDISRIVPSAPLIQVQKDIRALFLRSGSHKKAMLDLPKRRADHDRLLEGAKDILKRLGPEWSLENAESLRITDAQMARIRALSRELEPLLERQQGARKRKADLIAEMVSAQDDLANLPEARDTRKLEDLAAKAQRQGDLDAQFQKKKGELRIQEREVELRLKRLEFPDSPLDEIESANAPSQETIGQFEAEFSEVNARRLRIEESISEQSDRMLGLERQIKALTAAGSIPSEADLIQARKHRDEGWRLVRDAWLLGKIDSGQIEAYDPKTKDLAQAYEKSVRAADEVGDRLRNESGRVAKLAGFRADRAESKKRIAALEEALAQTNAAYSTIERRWIEVWRALHIRPGLPREMAAWLKRFDKLMNAAADLRVRRAEVEQIGEFINAHRRALSAELEALGEAPAEVGVSLDDLLDRCRLLVRDMTDTQRKRENLLGHIKDLHRRIADAEKDLEQVETAQKVWKKKWGNAVKSLKLDESALPAEADSVLDRSQQLFERMEQAKGVQGRIRAMEADGKKFSETVSELCSRLAPDLQALPADDAVQVLNERLEKALTDAARLEELEKQRKSMEVMIREEQSAIQDSQSRLAEMCEQMGVSSPEELPEMERKSTEFLIKKERIETLENELAAYSAGGSIEELADEAAEIDFDALPSVLDEQNVQIRALEEKRSELDQLIGSERTALSAMDGRGDAAELAEKSQELLAELKDKVERYAVVRVASTVLRKEIERYRKANQGPILERASELFSILTSHSFKGLGSDFDEKDTPILVGIRPSNETVALPGMSDGTCDQLYLALRLASIEQRLRDNEPVPLILDDILINFDDDRSRAALNVLSDLSKKTQIIFFTHHRHLVEIAASNIGGDTLFTHSLSS
jgi:uncharacterized protein YhaN